MKILKRLIPYAAPYKWRFVTVIFFGLLMSGAYFAMPWMVKELFDGAINNKDKGRLIIVPVMLVGIYTVHAIARYCHLFILKMSAERICTQLQKNLQEKYMYLNLSYYNSTDSGGMISKVISDVGVILHGFKIMADLIREPITIVGMLCWLVYLNWKLTLIILALGPITVFILNRIARSVKKYAHSQQESMEKLTSNLKETVDGVRIIQSFNLQEEMKRRLRVVVDQYLNMRRMVISRQEGAGPISEILGASAFGAILYYIGLDIIDGSSTIGSFMAYFAALAVIQNPIKKLQDGFVRIQQPIASLERLFEILDSGDVVKESPNAVPFPKNWSSITYKGVNFKYGDEPILRDVNIEVKRGEIIALVGESGSGKSTFVNLLERFFDPEHGEILIDNINIQNISLKDLRKNVALVSQDVFLFNDSISRNIQSGDFQKSEDKRLISESAKMANADVFINKTPGKFETMAGDRGGRLSGGEKQRVSIARAIYKDAPILILDEATSALDSVSEQEVQKGLDQLMQGRTAFVIAHRLSTISKADRIVVMKKGEIVEIGSHSELMEKKGQYFQFQQLQTLA